MSFAAPWALAGLVLAAIPLILHLLARREPPTVVFPATRYLAQAARQHQRRLQLQHLLLLLLRTLLVIALVLAAAGPSWPAASVGAHGPSALVVVVDNSLSSGAVRAGVPVLDGLKSAARAALARATPEDRVWLIAADGVARAGSPGELSEVVAGLEPLPVRLDLGVAVTTARAVLDGADRAGEALVVTDLQRTALGPGQSPRGLTLLHPDGNPVANAGVSRLSPGPQPWASDGGVVSVQVSGVGEGPRPVSVGFTGGPAKQILAPVGGQGTVRVAAPRPGWWTLEAQLDADELRADDHRVALVRVAPPARVAWRAEDRYVATAAEVLAQNGRIQAGDGVSLGPLGRGPSIVLPPADPAAVGALNRALAARGSRWRFGDLDLVPTVTDSGVWIGRERISRRYRLVYDGGAPSDVLATAGGQPWLARAGAIVLVGSRLDPEWTGLPLAAEFVPFLDALLNRAARGELVNLEAAPGQRVLLPDRVTEVVRGDRRWRVEGGAGFRPTELGGHFLLAEQDTIGALAVNPDPRETDLTRAGAGEVRALWPEARVGPLDEASRAVFAAGAQRQLRGPLLWVAAGLLLTEAALASRRRRT